MMYIEKQRPDQLVLDKIAEIKRTDDWKRAGNTKAVRKCFEQLPKSELRENMLRDQHYLCAYCMKRIENDSHTPIEHWYPLSKDKEGALDYDNMLCVCKGGSDTELSVGEKRILCCDAHKGETEIKLSPFNRKYMEQIKYTRSGTIYTDDVDLDAEINVVLRLNGLLNAEGTLICDTTTCLVKGRRDAYEQYCTIVETLDRRGKLTSASVKKQIDEILLEKKRKEFAGVLVFFLLKKYRLLCFAENKK